LVSLISGFVGFLLGKNLERWKLQKRFDSGYYEDLWRVIQNVNGVIQSGLLINDSIILKGIQEKYSCYSVEEYLQSRVRTNDKQVKKLLDDFVSNLLKYESEYDSFDSGLSIVEFQKCKVFSDDLTNRIEKRIRRLIVK
jgi:hypothetical protein